MLEKLLREDVQITRVNNRFNDPKGVWADVSINLAFPLLPGVVAELQVTLKGMHLQREAMNAPGAYIKVRFATEALTFKTNAIPQVWY